MTRGITTEPTLISWRAVGVAVALVAAVFVSCATPPSDEELGREFCVPRVESTDYYVGSPGYENCLRAGMWRPDATPPGWARIMEEKNARAEYFAQVCNGKPDGLVVDKRFSSPSTSSRVSWCEGGHPITVTVYDDSACYLQAELFEQKPKSC